MGESYQVDIKQPCTVSMLIHILQEMQQRYGDLEVVVSGCYASDGDVLGVRSEGTCINMLSDICSG